MNKSTLTNLICLILIGLSFALAEPYRHHLFNAGLFAFSGAITNWLAIHMLFERVPGLYGSGIIPLKFESFKSAIREMVMSQFFTIENIQKFIKEETPTSLHLEPVIDGLDTDHIFNGFLEVIQQSKLGSMLNMFGGAKVVEPLRAPFGETLKTKLKEITQSPDFLKALTGDLVENPHGEWQVKIKDMVNARLEELTPDMVKQIVQEMIRSHLGWLVVWGGVFGALIGLVSSFIH
ncbi:MAG: DUF445 domain-containing protein [Acidobacteria bacterium]|nr:DUF445 domain-containing protein [Acidobacteriota bacterium]MCB9399607.1 DUF445 domain-containing protein [Acidobacteriota bacterium]